MPRLGEWWEEINTDEVEGGDCVAVPPLSLGGVGSFSPLNPPRGLNLEMIQRQAKLGFWQTHNMILDSRADR